MRTKCYLVRLASLISISDKACKAIAFDGTECIIPKSQIYEKEYSVQKSDAYWISEWILSKVKIQYSSKKVAWFDNETRYMLPSYEITKHIPQKINIKENNEIEELKR